MALPPSARGPRGPPRGAQCLVPWAPQTSSTLCPGSGPRQVGLGPRGVCGACCTGVCLSLHGALSFQAPSVGRTRAWVRSGLRKTRTAPARSFRWAAGLVGRARGPGSRPLPSAALLPRGLAELKGRGAVSGGGSPWLRLGVPSPPSAGARSLITGLGDGGSETLPLVGRPGTAPAAARGAGQVRWCGPGPAPRRQPGHRAGPLTSG